MTHKNEAIFAAGCFWGVEAHFRKLEGVVETEVGYTGGQTEAPTYEDVCSGTTGHAEAVRIRFDAARVSYEALLKAFFACHDPTTLNRQGPDIGTQYRSAIFTCTDAQETQAKHARATMDASGRFPAPIVSEITPATTFFPAEDYHQRYLEKRSAG